MDIWRNRKSLKQNFLGCCTKPWERDFLPIIKGYIRPGTEIISDGWKAYNTLDQEGYTHIVVNYSKNLKDPVTGAHTNTIEGTWKDVKTSQESGNRNLLPDYFAEFIWRRFKKNTPYPFIVFFYQNFLFEKYKDKQ